MGIVLAFAVGYLVGANAGQEGYQDVVDSIRAVRDSEEFRDLLAALRSHAGATLRQLSDILEGAEDEALIPARLVDRVRDLMDRAGIDRTRRDDMATGSAS
jgi:hypothetical protein